MEFKYCQIFVLLVLIATSSMTPCLAKCNDESSSSLWWVVGGLGTAVVGVFAAPVIIAAAGFGTAGVVAGSLAAGVQAGMGGYIAAGSTFAVLQSAGAAGIGLGTNIAIAAVGVAAGAAATEAATDD